MSFVFVIALSQNSFISTGKPIASTLNKINDRILISEFRKILAPKKISNKNKQTRPVTSDPLTDLLKEDLELNSAIDVAVDRLSRPQDSATRLRLSSVDKLNTHLHVEVASETIDQINVPLLNPTGLDQTDTDLENYHRQVKLQLQTLSGCTTDETDSSEISLSSEVRINQQGKASIKFQNSSNTQKIQAVKDCLSKQIDQFTFETPPAVGFLMMYTFKIGPVQTIEF